MSVPENLVGVDLVVGWLSNPLKSGCAAQPDSRVAESAAIEKALVAQLALRIFIPYISASSTLRLASRAPTFCAIRMATGSVRKSSVRDRSWFLHLEA